MGDTEEKPSGPLEDRLVHKNWKWRVSGYEELANKFKLSEDGTGPLFNEYGPKFKIYLADANPMSQEKALECLSQFINRCDCLNKFSATFIPVLVEKCFPSSRPKVKDKTIECLIGTIEADAGESVLENLLKGTTSSSPKILLYSLVGIKECLKTFGPKVFPIKPILQKFSPWFEARDKNVRDEASNILIEIYRWIGKPLVQLIQEGLTPIQLKGLQEAFEKLPSEPAIPLKMTRADAAKQMAAAAKGGSGGAGAAKAEVVEEIDPYSLMSSVNILSKLGEDFYTGCKAAKWQERQEQIDKLVGILQSSPKIENGDFGALCSTLKKLIGDNNVMIMTKAVVAVGLMAEGLRGQFSGYSKQFVVPILERFKEKKGTIVQAIHNTMDSLVTKSFGLQDVVEEVISAITNAKVAWIKQEIFNWLARSITNAKKPQDIQKIAKPLAKIFMDNISDSNEPVRESSAKAFGALGGIIGERGMTPYLSQLDPIKAKKIKDSMPANAVAVAATPAVTMQAVDVSDIDLGGPKKPAGSSSKKGAASSGKEATTKSAKSISADDIQEKVKSIIPEDQLAGLASSDWKKRAESIDNIQETLKGLSGDSIAGISDYMVLYLQEKPGWKEANFQVMQGLISIISYLAKNDTSFNKNTAGHFLTSLIEKMSDVKLKDASIECLFSVCEAITPQAVFSALYPFAQAHKNPKVTAECLVWLAQAIEEFGAHCCTMKSLMDFAKSCLESTQTPIKNGAVKLFVAVRLGYGSLSEFTSDIKKPLLDVLDKEFIKIRDQKANPPTRTYKGAPAPGTQTKPEGPKVDISSKISNNTLDNLADNNWKTRNDALEEVERIIYDANKRIQPKLGQLVPSLKNRLTDSNQKVLTTTLNVISLLSQSIGTAFDKNVRILLPGVLGLLSDSKKPIRDAALTCMNQVLNDIGFDVFVGALAGPMMVDSATAKKESLLFATANWNIKAPVVMAEMTTLCKAICFNLCDKNAEVRSLTEQLLMLVSQYATLNDFKKEFREVKQANLQTVSAMIEKHYKAKAVGGAGSSNAAGSGTPMKKPSGTTSPTPPSTSSPQRITTTTTTKPTTSSKPPISSSSSSSNDIVTAEPSAKMIRQKEFTKPWLFEEPTEEVLEILQGQVLSAFNEEFANLMFSANPAQAQQMSDIICSMVDSDPDVIISVLDILFRWITFKLFDMGLASQKRILKILEVLLEKLINLEYTLSDYDASCLVPILTERMSTTNESIKALIKQNVKQLEELCPPTSMFKYVVENCKSSNFRTRLECLTELANLIDKFGVSIFGGVQNLKVACAIVSQSLNEPNNKAACILCFQKLYLHIKDEIWKFLPSSLSTQDKSTISGGNPINTSSAPTSGAPSSAKKQTTADNGLDDITNQFTGYLENLNNFVPGKETEYTIETLKQFSQFITANNAKKSVSDKFLPFLERYLAAITRILDEIFSNVFKDQALLRLCKYLVHAIITIYSNDQIAKQSNSKSLQIVLTESIKLLVAPSSDQSKQASVDSEWLTKGFNQVLLRILQKSNGTTLFSTLLTMITTAKSNKSPEKYNDLLIRCLLRASKLLKPVPNQPSISESELDVPILMTDINRFLSTPGLDETTKRATKTLTMELLNIKSAQIFQFCKNLISSHKHTTYTHLFSLLTELLGKSIFEESIGAIPPPIDIQLDSKLDNVVTGINLNSSLGSGKLDVYINSNNSNNSNRSSSSSTTTSTTSQSNPNISKFSTLQVNAEPRNYKQKIKSEDDKKDTLTGIFKKIGDPKLTMDGIYDLYYFLAEFPEVDISPQLKLTTNTFQSYISRNLAKVKDSIENTKEKSTDEDLKKYTENLAKYQNYGSSNPTSNAGGSSNFSQTSASSTLQRIGENITIPTTINPTGVTAPQPKSTTSSSNSDLYSTVASLRQRLAQIKETSTSKSDK